MDSAGNFSVKTSDLLKTYEYFGFKLVKGGSSHSRLVGPYGQTTSVVTTRATVDPGAASDLIRAIKRADEFNGELITFEKEPSPEKVALELKEKLRKAQNTETQTATNEQKDTEIKIANAKARIQSALIKIDNDLAAVESLKHDIVSLQTLNKDSNIHSIADDVSNLLTKLLKIEKEIETNKDTVNTYSRQLYNGYPLSEDNEQELEKINTADFDFESIKNELSKLEAQYLEIQEYKEILQNSIEEVIIDSKIFTGDITTELQKISAKIADASIQPFVNRAKKEIIENLIREIKNEIKIHNRQISKYANLNPDNYTKEELEKIKTNLRKSLAIRENYAEIEPKTFSENIMIFSDIPNSKSNIWQ